MSVCFDAYAVLIWLQNEAGAGVVEQHLKRSSSEPSFHCYVSAINLGEVYYRLYRLRGAGEAESFWQDVARGAIPIRLVEVTSARIREASRLKAQYPMAYADAFAAQVSMEKRVPLLTGDPEFKPLEKAGLLAIEWVSRTGRQRR